MATAAEQSARKKRKEEEAERRRLKELGILPEGVVPGQERGIAPPSNIDEIAASEAPYDDGYVEPDPSDFVNPLTESGTDPAVLPTEEEIDDRHSKAKSDALAEGRKEFYDLTGETVEGAKFDMPGAAEKRKEEDALEQKTFEEGREEFKQGTKDIIAQDQADHEERVKNNLYTNNPKDARIIEELEYREDRLRKLGSGMSRGEIAAADNPVWQQALAEKEAREAAELSIEEKAGIANKKTTAMDKAMRDAGHEVDREISPTFINPDTGKEEGGAHYTPSTHDVINVRDEKTGEIVGQKVVRKKGAPEDPDKPSPEEMKSRRDAYANKIREDAVAQKAERKRQAMIRTGDKHGIEQLDIRTAEGAATRLRDAEAAIRADETKSQTEKEIAIQELKNTGVAVEAQIGADAQTGVATTQAGAAMHASDAGVEIAAGQNQSAETINKNTTDAAQTQLETKVTADETAAENLAVTNAAAASAQADVNTAAAAVENAQTTSERQGAEEHLQLMQAGLLTAEEKRQAAEIAARKASEEREIAERERSQTSAQDATASEGEAQGQRDQALLDARNNSPEAVAARQRAAKAEAAENRTINQAILDDPSSTPGEQDAARRAIRDANRVLTGDDGSESNQIPVAESEEYLQNANPMTYQHTVELSSYVNDNDGDETTNWLSGNNTDALNIFVTEIRKNIKNGNIDVDELDSVGNILLSNMDPDMRESYERLIRARDGEDDRFWEGEVTSQKGQEEKKNYHNHADDTVTYLEKLFAGKNPTNADPYVPITTEADRRGPHPDSLEGRRRESQRDLDTPSPWGLN